MNLQEKLIAFGAIANEAAQFRAKAMRRLLGPVGLNPKVFRLAARVGVRRDLLRIDTPPELSALLWDALTDEDRKSPYAKIVVARFSLPALAQHTIVTLGLTKNDLAAIRAVIKARKEQLFRFSGKKMLAVCFAALGWLTQSVPEEVLKRWNISKAAFVPAAFYVGLGLLGMGLYLYAIDVLLTGKARDQEALVNELLVYCEVELGVVAKDDDSGEEPDPSV